MPEIKNKLNFWDCLVIIWSWIARIWNWINKYHGAIMVILAIFAIFFGYQKYQEINLDLNKLKVELLEVEGDAIIKGNATTTGELTVGNDGPPRPGCLGMKANDGATWIYLSFTSNGNIVTTTNASMCGLSTSTALIGR